MSTAQEKERQTCHSPSKLQISDDTKCRKSLEVVESAQISEQCDTISNSIPNSSKENEDKVCDSVNSTPRVNGGDSCTKDEDFSVTSNPKSTDEISADQNPVETVLDLEQLQLLTKEELTQKLIQLNKYLNSIVQKACKDKDTQNSSESEERLKVQFSELQKKEQYHAVRLATKEHEIQELSLQVEELKSLTTGVSTIKHSLLDPAVNVLYEKMKKDLDTTKAKMEETQNELAAWKFTPDSNTGKQLMAKCRLLIKENEELGKMISSGKLAKLEADLTIQSRVCDELKKSQSELDELLQEMDEDTEGMQGTILYLQDELRQSKKSGVEHTHNGQSQCSAAADSTETSDNGPVSETPVDSVVSNCVEERDSLKRTASDMDQSFEVDERVSKKARTSTPEVVENGV